ncbi:type II toxin-antitoxin system RelE/ParE family toxin [Sphingopyxis sp. YF1]|uniref:type II toxin-antitoxin system RelE/ParE family toxin n=1 Tax=Sphingopyxis sp. YF1 TaxID=2482763 RepID=UPI001F6212D4|nr:type II toxin-antitoxin system RelE/ParE family toxin [Sphingopyxis sp. YF1]UNU41494.1 type II toxin-antitoxin system RelE/ParE family toxin [Sphingopyxis sp. YF1]
MTASVRVVWRQTATDDLYRLYDWIADRADPDTAFAYTSAIEAHAADLATYPNRGTPRDDLAPGVRTLNFPGRTAIALAVVVPAYDFVAPSSHSTGHEFGNFVEIVWKTYSKRGNEFSPNVLFG